MLPLVYKFSKAFAPFICSGQDIAHLVLFAHLIAGRYCGAGRGEAHRRRVWRGTGYGLLMSVMSGVLKLHFVTGPAA